MDLAFLIPTLSLFHSFMQYGKNVPLKDFVLIIKNKKCSKIIGLIRQLSVNFPHNTSLTISKSFIRPHLDYGDILYDKPSNDNFQNKMEKVQYRACLAITGGIHRTSRERLYDELGFHS